MMPGLPGPDVALGTALQPRRDEFPTAMHVLTEVPGRGGILARGTATCHRCGTVATTQWRRRATDTEREQHWAAQEQHIRSIPDLYGNRNGAYTADRSQDVVKAVFGCAEHIVDDTLTVHAADCGGHGACQCEGTTTNG